MLKDVYYRLHRLISRPKERGEYSAGLWQDAARKEALNFCRNIKGRILEVGCGEGLFLNQLVGQNPGLEIWGIDNSSERISQAEQRLDRIGAHNFHLSVEDATRLPFAEEFFDAVVCINVFYNMPSKEVVKDTFSQMKRVCKKQGIIIFDFRNAANFLLRLKYKIAPFYDETVSNLPLKTYYPGEMEALLSEFGLGIIQRSYLGASGKRFAPIIIIEAQKI